MRTAALMIPASLLLGACATTEAPYSASAVERCGSVDLRVTVTDEDEILINDEAATREDLVAAARAKDAVCNNAAALVLLNRPGVQGPNASFVRQTLMAEIENLTMIEAVRDNMAPSASDKPS